jgi:hypothetical protein
MTLIKESLETLHVKCKLAPPSVNDRGMETMRLRVGGHDLRKEMFKGWVEVERFIYRSSEGSFCVMKRDEVSSDGFFSPDAFRFLKIGFLIDHLFCSSYYYFREVPFHGDNYGRV